MIDIGKGLRNSAGFLSFLIGMGLMILIFHKPYDYKHVLGTSVSNIENKVVKHGGKCFF